MTVISRLLLDHPALDTAGGAGLHASIENLYLRIGDNMDSRFFTEDALADSSSVTFEHNFKTDFDSIRFDLYLRDTGTGELTRVTEASTPSLSDFDVAATAGFLTTKVDVTNNSGSAQDVALVLVHNYMDAKKVHASFVEIAANGSLKSGLTYLVDTASALTLTLPAAADGKAVIVVKDSVGDAVTNPITISPSGGAAIDGTVGSYLIDWEYGAASFMSDGSNWWLV